MERLLGMKVRTGDLITDRELPGNLEVTAVVGGKPIDDTLIQVKKLQHSQEAVFK